MGEHLVEALRFSFSSLGLHQAPRPDEFLDKVNSVDRLLLEVLDHAIELATQGEYKQKKPDKKHPTTPRLPGNQTEAPPTRDKHRFKKKAADDEAELSISEWIQDVRSELSTEICQLANLFDTCYCFSAPTIEGSEDPPLDPAIFTWLEKVEKHAGFVHKALVQANRNQKNVSAKEVQHVKALERLASDMRSSLPRLSR